MKKERAFRLNHAVFWPVVIIMAVILAISFINQEWFSTIITNALNAEVINFKWMVGPVVLFLFITMLVLLIHPVGKIKIGGNDAKAKFSNFSYWGLCICSTIAIGIVFWGVAQPLTYFMEPWPGWGLEAGSPEAAVKAIAQTNLEWSWGQYTLYGIFAITMAVAIYNHNQPERTSSFLYMLRGKPANNVINIVVDILCLFGIVAGVTCSLGTGTMQMSAGIHSILGVDITKMLWLLVELIVVAGFLLMSVGGIAKGIRIVTDQNLRLYYIVMALMVVIGPTLYIFDMYFESHGYMFNNMIQDITYTGGINGDDSPIFWMIWLYVSAVAFAPIIGLFIAKISYGRTIKEMVVGNLIMPALVNSAWFVIFGATAINWQTTGEFDIWGRMEEMGMEAAMFEFFEHLPFGKVFSVVFWIVILLSFVTLASSATTSAALTSMIPTREIGEDEEPPMWIKVIWALIMAVSAYVFISFAGIDGAKSMALIGGMPSMVLVAIAGICVWIMMMKSGKKEGNLNDLGNKKQA